MKLNNIAFSLILIFLTNLSQSQLHECDRVQDLFDLENFELVNNFNLNIFLQEEFPDEDDPLDGFTKLGSGSYGHVIQVTLKDLESQENFPVALKIVRFTDMESKRLLSNEIIALKKVSDKHPLTTSRYLKCAVSWDGYGGGTGFILTEKLDFDLWDERFQQMRKSYPFSVELFLTMTRAVRDLHLEGYAHYDIKPTNFIYKQSNPPIIKLIDFGMIQVPNNNFVGGSPNFIAPQTFLRKATSRMADNYSLGLTFFDLFFGIKTISLVNKKPLFSSNQEIIDFFNNRQALIDKNCNKQIKDKENVLDRSTYEAFKTIFEVIKGLTKNNISERMSIPDAINKFETYLETWKPNSLYREVNLQDLMNAVYADDKLEPKRYVQRIQKVIVPKQAETKSNGLSLASCFCMSRNNSPKANKAQLGIHKNTGIKQRYVPKNLNTVLDSHLGRTYKNFNDPLVPVLRAIRKRMLI